VGVVGWWVWLVGWLVCLVGWLVFLYSLRLAASSGSTLIANADRQRSWWQIDGSNDLAGEWVTGARVLMLCFKLKI
jgi:hypothetical protein